MNTPLFATRTRRTVLQAAGAGLTLFGINRISAMAQATPEAGSTPMSTLPNIVLVHGAWADATSWSGVIQKLLAAGYHVSAAQISLNSLTDDIDVVKHMIGTQDGPTVVVGHSYGGSVITGAAAGATNVVGLVYISAFVPDTGESVKTLGEQGEPGAGLAAIRPDDRGYLWIDPALFAAAIAADVDPATAEVMAVVQKPFSSTAYGEPVPAAAWHDLPSWYLVSENDQVIPPAAQQLMAGRAGATVVSVPSSHASLVSHAAETTDLIMQAATATS